MISGGLMAASVVAVVAIIFCAVGYQNGNHETALWKSARRELLSIAKEYDLRVNEASCRAEGVLEGLPFSIGLKTITNSRSQHVNFWAELKVPGCPSGFGLSQEDLFSGVMRIFGSEELSLGDPEFDAAFWITGDSVEETKSFLTPDLRKGLLHGMSGLPNACVKDGKVTAFKLFSTPFLLKRQLRPRFEHFRLLAQAFNQGGELVDALPAGRSGAVATKLRRFIAGSLFLWLPSFLVSFNPEIMGGPLLQGVLFLGILLSVFAYTASEMSRVILQSFYAFLTLLLGCGMLWGLYTATFLEADLNLALAIGVFGGTGLALLWGARHFLKSLDQTRVVNSSETSERPSL